MNSQYIVDKDFRFKKEKASVWTVIRRILMFFVATISLAIVYYILFALVFSTEEERALKQETADEAYKKGVEMTMNQLKDVLAKLGITEIPALGEKFDPNCHNAVMHVDDDSVEENTIVEVFQTGFKSGDKIVRFSMVKVAN